MRTPRAISVRKILMLEPLAGREVRIVVCRRLRKVEIPVQV